MKFKFTLTKPKAMASGAYPRLTVFYKSKRFPGGDVAYLTFQRLWCSIVGHSWSECEHDKYAAGRSRQCLRCCDKWQSIAMLQASPDTDLSVSGEVIGGWRPIETAPRKVEFRCLLGHEHSVVTGYWDGAMWVNERSLLRSEFKPTHWMPLPAQPIQAAEKGE